MALQWQQPDYAAQWNNSFNPYQQMGYQPYSTTPGTALNAQLNPGDAAKWGGLSFMNKANTIFGGLQTLGNLYGAIQSIRLGKQQLRDARNQWNQQWGLARKTHNEALELRAHNLNNGNKAAVDEHVRKFSI